MTISRPERFTAIMKAHVVALGDRDHRDVSAAELFPKIAEAVPGVTHEEIIAAFQHTADRAIEQARQLLPTFPSGRVNDRLLRRLADFSCCGFLCRSGDAKILKLLVCFVYGRQPSRLQPTTSPRFARIFWVAVLRLDLAPDSASAARRGP